MGRKEAERIPLSAKLGMAAGALFISGAAAIGVGIYKTEQNSERIQEAENRMSAEIPEKDMAARWVVAAGTLSVASSAVTGGIALGQADIENFRKKLKDPRYKNLPIT